MAGRSSPKHSAPFAAAGEIEWWTSELAGLGQLDASQSQHSAILAIHGLCAAILHAEAQGATRADLRESLAEARALHARSSFLARLQSWPRGYAGDFETIEMLCDGRTLSADPAVRPLEWYSLNTAVAQQHRNKVARQAALIGDTMACTQQAEVLLIGCGGCRDLRALGPGLGAKSPRVTLNDADPAALDFALAHLPQGGIRYVVAPGNALRVVPRLARAQRFDLILAGGLFDYLPDNAAVLLLRHAWSAVRPGGTLFFTNVARENPYRPWMENLVDWTLLARGPEDLERLVALAGIPVASLSLERDATELAHFAELQKSA